MLSVIVLTDCTDEEIEDQFYRLNNGTALTKDQKTRVLLGDELSAFIDRVEASEFFSEKSHKSYFTSLQRKRGEVQTCILQTLMLVMDYQFKNFNNDATMEFAEWFRANHKNSDLEYCEELFEWIQELMDSYTPDCEYASYCGQSATSRIKVMARLEYVEKELRKLVEK